MYCLQNCCCQTVMHSTTNLLHSSHVMQLTVSTIRLTTPSFIVFYSSTSSEDNFEIFWVSALGVRAFLNRGSTLKLYGQ